MRGVVRSAYGRAIATDGSSGDSAGLRFRWLLEGLYRTARLLPRAKAAGDVGNRLEAHALDLLRGERGAQAACTEEHELVAGGEDRFEVRAIGIDPELEHTPRGMEGAGNHSLALELADVAQIDQGYLRIARERLGLFDRQSLDLGLRLGDELLDSLLHRHGEVSSTGHGLGIGESSLSCSSLMPRIISGGAGTSSMHDERLRRRWRWQTPPRASIARHPSAVVGTCKLMTRTERLTAGVLRGAAGVLLLFGAAASPSGPTDVKSEVGRPAAGVAANRSAPTLEELRNAAYEGVEEAGGSLTLTDGKWEGEPFVEGGASRPSVILVRDLRLVGDLDGDGREEAVVLLAAETGGSGEMVYLAVVRRTGTALENIATAPVGDRVQLRDWRIDGRAIVLEVVQAGEKDAACGASRHRRSRK
jgi:hypothetical protein